MRRRHPGRDRIEPSPGPSRHPNRHLRLTTWVLGLLAMASGLWLGVRSLASLFAPRLFPPLHHKVSELAVFVATLIAFGLLGKVMGGLARAWHPHDPFTAFSDALSRLARGEFDTAVDLPEDIGPHGFGKFADEINDLARSLKRMEELRQEFIATVSHDIQSPLTSIIGFARALRGEGLPEATRAHYLDIIESESARLSRLSADLLRLTALEAQEMAPNPKTYALGPQIRDAVLGLEPQWRVKQLDLDLALAPVTIQADPDLLAQVWANLLHNACKFSSPGGRLTVTLTGNSGLATVKVADAGAGIAAEDLPHIFDRFFKADRARSAGNPEAAGSGLGLAIARKIVTLHGGSIRAESQGPGFGAVFTVELPLG